jgi:hypothetical protein
VFLSVLGFAHGELQRFRKLENPTDKGNGNHARQPRGAKGFLKGIWRDTVHHCKDVKIQVEFNRLVQAYRLIGYAPGCRSGFCRRQKRCPASWAAHVLLQRFFTKSFLRSAKNTYATTLPNLKICSANTSNENNDELYTFVNYKEPNGKFNSAKRTRSGQKNEHHCHADTHLQPQSHPLYGMQLKQFNYSEPPQLPMSLPLAKRPKQ